ncbi:MAG: TetR/AcrR family transcriptional regulator [Gammaproteobacteria bacterium]|nr:TetR/AcrR family transcriptional regulator [Gammaproteobacteria bacterium]
MPYLERKQRDLQRRVDLILGVGRELLLKSGYRGLTMTRIAELTEYSKGTIYQHFSCKEEIVHRLATESIKCLLLLLDRVKGYQGNGMLKVALVAEAYILFYRLYPLEFSLLSTIRSRSVRERINAQKYAEIESLEQSALNIISGIVADSVNEGELMLIEGFSAEELASGIWFMIYGGLTLHEGSSGEKVENDKYFHLTRKNFQYYVSSWSWSRQVADEFGGAEELNSQLSQIKNVLFKDEMAKSAW